MAGPVGTTQFINEKLAEETPIFSKVRVSFTPTHPLTHLVVSNNTVVMALANRTLIRIDQDSAPDKLDEVDISKVISGAKIANLFLDHTGRHLLISMKPNDVDSQSELLYLHKKSSKPKTCGKFKGSQVSAVAFSHDQQPEGSTGPILCGTTLGLVMESELASDDRMFSRDTEIYFRQLYDVGKGRHVPVTGIEYYKVPNTNKYYVILTTHQKIYQFQGYVGNSSERPLLHHVFNNYLTKRPRCLEFPKLMKRSALSMYYDIEGKRKLPTHFVWLNGSGLFTGRVDPWEGDGDSVWAQTHLIPMSEEVLPRNALATQFHILMLYPDRVKSMCLLNNQIVYDDVYDLTHGNLVGIAHDQMKNVYWAYTDYAVYKYKVMDEARNIWRIHLEKGNFDLAKEHCGNEPLALDLIMTKEAEKMFEDGCYEASASLYAKTKTSFERVCLKFLGLEDREALMTYVKKKLDSLKASEKTQITLLVVWTIELYQNRLGEIRESVGKEDEGYKKVQLEFIQFLKLPRVEECIRNNRDSVYNLLGSHGDTDHLVFLAETFNDTEKLIQYNLRNEDYQAVLNIITRQASPDFFYEFCPILLREIPQQTVDTLINQGKRISPSKLLPAVVVVSKAKDKSAFKECVKFLEHCVHNLQTEDQAIHNLLVSLYISEGMQNKIMPYLTQREYDHVVDVRYLLKLCLGADLKEEAVYLFTMLGQHEKAVDLALTVSLDLAVQVAGGQLAGGPLQEDVRKKLWLHVAKHVVQEKQDIKQAMEFLHQCPSVKIEDILPFFPDFVTIDHFKSAIVDSLQEYSKHIADLKGEMSEATRSAQVIRSEIAKSKERFQFVRATDRCSSCGDLLLSRQFYLFSCSHRFHFDCLIDTVTPFLSSVRRKRVAELQQVMLQGVEETGSLDSKSYGLTRQEAAEQELTEIVADECCYCGELMIRDIDNPFIPDDQFEKVINDWL